MAATANLIIVFTAPDANAETIPAERWFVPHMLAALRCTAPPLHTALLSLLRSLDIFLEVSQAAMQLFHDSDGAPALLTFCQAVLDDAVTHIRNAEEGRGADLAPAGPSQPDTGAVPASHRVVVRVRVVAVPDTQLCTAVPLPLRCGCMSFDTRFWASRVICAHCAKVLHAP